MKTWITRMWKKMAKKERLRPLLALLLAIMFGAAATGGCSSPTSEAPAPETAEENQEPAPSPEPQPEPEPELDPEPEAYLPLTGKGVDADDPRLNRRALAVKIENTAASRPSQGLIHADVVYETLTEGGITRFCAIFHSDVPDEAGPVRSARNSDISIIPQYGALFVYSGSNATVREQMAGIITDYISEGNAGSSFYRVKHKVAPHNLYFDPKLGFERFEAMGCELDTPPNGLDFGDYDTESPGAGRATEIFVPFSAAEFDVTWKYDANTGVYLRYIAGVEQVDETDGTKQLSAENVVLLSASYTSATYIEGRGQTYNLKLNGEGDAIIFRDGVRIEATWHTDGTRPHAFKDAGGKPILLKPGKTWFQVPYDISVVEVIE